MNEIPLFDSLTHPTLTGDWIGHRYAGRNTLAELETQMERNSVRWAFAVGMAGIGGYEVAQYREFIASSTRQIHPVAYYEFDPRDGTAEIQRKVETIGRLGYRGIKLHLRFAGIPLRGDALPAIVRCATERGLFAMICTYLFGRASSETGNTLLDFPPLLARIPEEARVILLHGGTVNLMSMMEICREFPNVLLDLSWTLCKYEGSSLDQDIRFLFQQFDQRICVGSDSPEFGLDRLRRRFDFFAADTPREKNENIAFRNLMAFTGLGQL